MTTRSTFKDYAAEPVLYAVEDRVATISFNRSERNNAWTGALQLEYFRYLQKADQDEGVRVIVVTGVGRSFCPGADMEMLAADAADGGQDMASRDRALRHLVAPKLQKPVIAAINGACAGIGFVHALLCDLRFAARGANFSTAFSRRGILAEHGASWLLPRLIGLHRAFDILATGRKFDADEAMALGLLNGVFEPEELIPKVMEYAKDIAEWTSPTSVAAIKYQLYRHLETDLESAMQETFTMLLLTHLREDTTEGAASFLEKRKPNFPPIQEFRSI